MNPIVVSVAGATAATALAQVSQGRRPDAGIFVGGTLAGITLTGLSMAGRSSLANRFAALILITSLMVNGATLATAYNRYTNREG